MIDNIQNKLLKFEMPPPAGAWQNISNRLDKEFDQAEGRVSEKLSSATLEPPSHAWKHIIANLRNSEEKGIIIPIKWKRVAAAAIIIGLIGTTILILTQNRKPSTTGEIAAIDLKLPDSLQGTVRALAADEEVTISGNLDIADIIPQTATLWHNAKKTVPALFELSSKIIEYEDPDNEPGLRSGASQTIRLADATKEAAVMGPSIRDANGKIIMDMSLLTTQSGKYITITGPNGEQTRISSKFADFLTYLNNSPEEEEEEYFDFLFRTSDTWKKRFEEWRALILLQANFSPGCTTFFDILELKELIKD